MENFNWHILLLPGKWLNGMTYIGATPALHLGAEAATCGPHWYVAGYLQDLVGCPRFEDAHVHNRICHFYLARRKYPVVLFNMISRATSP